ncbi:MAG TPA: isoprenylcysteine carboxylmethyltransferase family protein [Candidatus Acidoferrales bacterium]|nr:isoprenylcysteine carboxylmethyltransferase family protein [Candidatus Acidoferrales bacterium]
MTNKDGEDSAVAVLLLKLLLFTVFVPGTVTVWLPLFVLYPAIRRQALEWNPTAAGAIVLIVLGLSGYLWCALDFAFVGKGTPAPFDMPKFLVARGLYRYARNPMYISVLLVLVGESTLFASLTLLEYAAAVAIGFHIFVLVQEEPTLRRKMGPAYAQYCRDVPRWFPRIVRGRRHDAI